MRCYVFLRAVNVGGRRMTNDDQIAALVALGVSEVAAYQAAGNLTFEVDDSRVASHDDVAALESAIESALADAFGIEVPAFVVVADRVGAIVEEQPFTSAQLAATEGRVQVTVMRSHPDPETWASACELVPDDDLVALGDRVWYWLPVAGVSTSSLPVAAVERVVGPMTMRTLGTVERMLAKFGT